MTPAAAKYGAIAPRAPGFEERRKKMLEQAERERNALVSEAKASVGIWSHYGISEVRERFWKAYQAGKDMAKRMTWWDFILGTGGNRDEEAEQ